jgi:phosphoribosylaminoimidazole-succinocarboxamide synthase
MNTWAEPLLGTNLPLPLRGRGKVRDLYDADGHLLIVATDRISAFDCILPSGIPRKGEVLTQLSLFWFEFLRDVVPNHLVSATVAEYCPQLGDYSHQLQGRSMLVRRATMFPVECVARGYLSGSGWIEYQQTGSICGIPLPAELAESDRLPEPVFTPATKADSGHDENIPFAAVEALVGRDNAQVLRTLTLEIYRRASLYAESRGIIIADTKVEFGIIDGQVTLADEVLTPDSSRFWPANEYQPGRPQPSYDKQFVRDYLLQSGWNKQPPAPVLPQEVVEKTASKYQEAYRLLTGRSL